MAEFNTISAEHLDVFREIGNIGAGNAATALASMLGHTIKMSVPNVKLVPFSEIPNIIGGPELVIVGGMVEFTGDLTGYLILVLGLEQAKRMISALFGTTSGTNETPGPDDFNEMEHSALNEIMNILSGSYLSAIGEFTRLKIIPSIPYMCVDMVGAVLSIIAVEYGKYSDNVLFFETKFSDESKETLGNFFLAPNQESYERLLSSLGVDI